MNISSSYLRRGLQSPGLCSFLGLKVLGVEQPGGGLKGRGCGCPIALLGSGTQARQRMGPQDSLKTGDLRGLQSCSVHIARLEAPLLASLLRRFKLKAACWHVSLVFRFPTPLTSLFCEKVLSKSSCSTFPTGLYHFSHSDICSAVTPRVSLTGKASLFSNSSALECTSKLFQTCF